MKKFLILCAMLIVNAVFADTKNLNWMNDGSVYAQTTCTIGSDLILPTAPTKRGHTFVGWLPYVYLEYIESTGTQYIDTGYIFTTDNAKVEITWLNSTSVPAVMTLFGCYNNARARSFLPVVRSNGTEFQPQYGSSFHAPYTSCPANTKHTVVMELKNGIATTILDNVKIHTDTVSSINKVLTNFLFAYNNTNGVAGDVSTGQIYSCKIWDNDILVRNFIPCKNSSGVVGMCDTLSSTFFTNSGTGTFIAGPVRQ